MGTSPDQHLDKVAQNAQQRLNEITDRRQQLRSGPMIRRLGSLPEQMFLANQAARKQDDLREIHRRNSD